MNSTLSEDGTAPWKTFQSIDQSINQSIRYYGVGHIEELWVGNVTVEGMRESCRSHARTASAYWSMGTVSAGAGFPFSRHLWGQKWATDGIAVRFPPCTWIHLFL